MEGATITRRRRKRKRGRESSTSVAVAAKDKEEERRKILGRKEAPDEKQFEELVESKDVYERLDIAEALAEGTFGCVLKGYNVRKTLMGFGAAHHPRAIKVQAITTSLLEGMARKEATLSRLLSTIVERGIAPGVAQFFDAFVSRAIPVSWVDAMRTKCPNFHDNHLQLVDIVEQKGGKRRVTQTTVGDRFLISVSEFGDGGSLSDHMEHRTALNQPFNIDELRNIAFQLCWTMHALQSTLGFRHFDFKHKNVVLKRVTENRIYQFTSASSGQMERTWMFGIGPTEQNAPFSQLLDFDYEVKLIDFGLSSQSQSGSAADPVEKIQGTVPMLEPETLFRLMEGDSSRQAVRGFDADIWAVGITLAELSLTGWIRPQELEHVHWRPHSSINIVEEPLFLLYQEIGDVSQVAERNNTLRRLRKDIVSEAEAMASFRGMNASQFFGSRAIAIEVLVGVCLFQNACGHGLLPEPTPELEQNPVYIVLRRNRDALAAIGQVSYRDPFNPQQQRTRHFYSFVIDRLRFSYTDSGLELILSMLSWSRTGRQFVGQTWGPGLFYNCITHPFFSPKRDFIMRGEVEGTILRKNQESGNSARFQYLHSREQQQQQDRPSWLSTFSSFLSAAGRRPQGDDVLWESPWTMRGPATPIGNEIEQRSTTAATSDVTMGAGDPMDAEDEVMERAGEHVNVLDQLSFFTGPSVATSGDVFSPGSLSRITAPIAIPTQYVLVPPPPPSCDEQQGDYYIGQEQQQQQDACDFRVLYRIRT